MMGTLQTPEPPMTAACPSLRESLGSPNLPEAAVCATAVAKLRTDGWRVACEVYHMHRPIDAVATRAGKVLVLEAKVGLTKKLRQQIWFGTYGADYAIAAVKTRPRPEGLEWCRKVKVGLWLVRDGVIDELVAPEQHDDVHGTYRERLTQAVEAMYEQQTPGGLPCLAGEGAAQDVQRRVDEYRESHPKATWREIHANVPNHYRTAPNMYSALRSNQERLAFRARMKARRLANAKTQP